MHLLLTTITYTVVCMNKWYMVILHAHTMMGMVEARGYNENTLFVMLEGCATHSMHTEAIFYTKLDKFLDLQIW